MADSGEKPILLHSRDHSELLDAIDVLRSLGVSHYVPLPQLIVCGDQSSGKSSVLEAVSGVKFPTKDNLCTRFATELILRRGPNTNVAAAITPGINRTAEQKSNLFKVSLSATGTEDVPYLIENAKQAMGLDSESGAFSDDVLRIEITGPKQSHLTLVDLPGLIHAENKQQSAQDVELVHALVQRYMASSRSIILAVVSAKNDYANQIVTKLARQVDPKGLRTLGIITKPDTLYEGSESEKAFISLAKNEDVVFRLGWHALKNRDYADRNSSLEERDESEAQFFLQSVWSSLPGSSLGAGHLKPRLSCLLRDQIVTELPSLIHEIEEDIQECRKRLNQLGDARGNLQEQRMYLLRVGQSFCSLVEAATGGIYVNEFFGDAMTKLGEVKRLRAVIQGRLLEFSEEMRLYGHGRQIIEDSSLEQEDSDANQVTRPALLQEVKILMRKTRGRELPGTFNPLIVGDLFFKQAQPWKEIVRDFSQKILDAVNLCLRMVTLHVMDESTGAGIHREIVDPAMERCKITMQGKMAEIMKPHRRGHPITYNHYFTETVQKARRKHEEQNLRIRINKFFKLKPEVESFYLSRQEFATGELLAALATTNEQDMELYACSEAVYCMEAYYKVRNRLTSRRIIANRI